jgi:Flp pilus assembly protein TadB
MMKKYITLLPLIILMIVALPGCDFLGGVFKTGVGVGIFIAVVIIVLIFLIARIGRRNRL